MRKYEFTEETKNVLGVILHRIKALRDFGNVKAGDIGGWIEKEDNLSHEGACWVYGNARVCGDAEVYGNAMVHGDAEVCDYAEVYGNAEVHGNARVYGNAEVYGNAMVHGDAEVHGDAMVHGNARVCGDARVYGNAEVYGNARVCGDAMVHGDAEVCGNKSYIVFKNWWSSGRYFTWTRSNNMWKVGCFHGTGDELIKKAYKDSEASGREYERVVRYVESILREGER